MWAASELADWWDQQHRESKKELERFVDRNPNLFGVIVATTTETAMQLGEGMVDVLRLGEGAAEGGWKGYAKDTLRAISIAGAVGKAAKLVQSARGIRLAKLIVDPGGTAISGRCAYVSATQALKQVGQRAYVAVDELAQELGKPMEGLTSPDMGQLRQMLVDIGAKVKVHRAIQSLEEVVNSTPRDGSVTLIGLDGLGAGGARVSGHCVYGFWDSLGRFRIMDRGGLGRTGEVFSSLEELARKYGRQAYVPRSMARIQNLFLKFVGPKGTATLAMSVLAATATHPETVAQAFHVMKEAAKAGPNPAQNPAGRPGLRYHVVGSGDWLSKIAGHYYGDIHKWPVIYNANLEVIGHNPHAIKPGQRLWIPELPAVSFKKRVKSAAAGAH